MPRVDGPLFADSILQFILDRQGSGMQAEIEKLSESDLLSRSVEALADYFSEKYRLKAPVLQDDHISARVEETRVDARDDPSRYVSDRSRPIYIPATRFVVTVPFSGDSDLFSCRPSQSTLNTPLGSVAGQVLTIAKTAIDTDETTLMQWSDGTLAHIRSFLNTLAADVKPYNEGLLATARERVEARRNRILKGRGLVAALGFKLETRPDAPRMIAVELRKTQPPFPLPSKPSDAPEPALDDAQYEHILSILRPMASTMERDPMAFRTLGEEHLRSFFLAVLNSHVKGRATGETFNASGKTDILIREDDRNVFIAECKIWKGPQSLRDALDQVLGYAAWRDSKLAILLFSKNKGFSEVLKQIDPVVSGHPRFKRRLEMKSESEGRYRFQHPDDVGRELTLSVLAFSVPA